MSADRPAPDTHATTNVVWQPPAVTRVDHEKRNGHKAMVVWLTGLPGSGKSTIAQCVEKKLHDLRFQTVVLDGDNMRHGLCSDLGFSIAERNENVRRTGEVAKLFFEQGAIVLVALVSPMQAMRDQVRQLMPAGRFAEVYVQCPLDLCKQRDPKGLYAKAGKGTVADMTGVSSPYEEPLHPDLILDTGNESAEASASQLIRFLLAKLKRD